jgi:hypothetical protein
MAPTRSADFAGEVGGGGGLGTVTDLLLRKAQAVRAGAQSNEDYDVISPDGRGALG